MARGINKWIGIGNCCADPEVRSSAGGAAICNITVACGRSRKDKQGNIVDETEFVRVVFFNRLAEIAGEYLRKGSKVYIEGRLQTRKWQDKDGNDRYTTEIVASEMQMLDSQNAENNQSNDQGPPAQSRPAPAPRAPAPQPSASSPPPAMDQFDDDIPF